MQRLIACVLAAGLILTASTVRADEWQGFQTISAIHGDVSLEKTERVHLRASAHLFWEPATGTHLFFLYAGPRFIPTDWFSISPQVGVAGRWAPNNGNAFLTSVWTKFTLQGGAVIVFLESDVYLAPEVHDYYGYYEAYVSPPWKAPVGFGWQVEQVNVGFKVGPQVGAAFGPFSVTLQYFVTTEAIAGHMLRVVSVLSF